MREGRTQITVSQRASERRAIKIRGSGEARRRRGTVLTGSVRRRQWGETTIRREENKERVRVLHLKAEEERASDKQDRKTAAPPRWMRLSSELLRT